MFGEYWLPKREYLVECTEYSIAEEAALSGYNIIIDDTNLNPKYIDQWNTLASDYNYEIEFKEFKIPIEQAIKWDKERENPVGEDVIRKFYNKYYANV
jgi:predicted kinase